ncbi:MAG TPA: peptide ABC transporter substrate-binding protein [Thermomicrobiales bacterium]|jgi:ABC-type transport system substrate-binding protein|nr:peptide ABC transporter substrate-binding protein [Thermomicrobiales bacterium]
MPRLPQDSSLTPPEQDQLNHLIRTMRSAGGVSLNRRDLARVSAVAAGAVATARFGVQPAAAAARQEGDPQTDQELLIPFNTFGEQVILDPHQAVNWGPFWLLLPNVFGGLLRYREDGSIEYDLAESYEVSDDGRVYTFRIRPDVTYANGTPVIADHFVQSWTRALNPDRLSPMAEFMSVIEGYDAVVNREDGAQLGVEAVDDQTLEVTLVDGLAYFPSYAASFVYAVVDPAVFESNPDDFYLNDAGTGPWRITAFEQGGDIVMEPNTEYYGGTSPSLSRLTWRILSGSDAGQAALDLYTNEDAISADVTISLVESVRGNEALAADLRSIEFSGYTRSLAMDFSQEPFNNVGVRRAFAQATDRERFASEIYLDTYTPTTSFTPPVTEQVAGYEAPEGIAFDADAAASSLADAGFANGEGLPEIVLFQPASDTDEEKARVAAFLATYQETLGVTITQDTSLSAAQIELAREDTNGLQFNIVDWSIIGDTPYLLSYALRPDSPYMTGFYNWNADLEDAGEFTPGADAQQFADLVADADREQDPDARNDLYAQAEELALQNAVYVPIGNWVQQFVQKPWLQGTRQGAWTGRLPILFDQDVVVIGR